MPRRRRLRGAADQGHHGRARPRGGRRGPGPTVCEAIRDYGRRGGWWRPTSCEGRPSSSSSSSGEFDPGPAGVTFGHEIRLRLLSACGSGDTVAPTRPGSNSLAAAAAAAAAEAGAGRRARAGHRRRRRCRVNLTPGQQA